MSIKTIGRLALILFSLGTIGTACNKGIEKAIVIQNVVHDKKTYQTGIILKEISNKSRAEYTGTYSPNKQIEFSNLVCILQINTLDGVYTASISPYKKVEELELKEGYKVKFVINDPDRPGKEFNKNKVGKIYYDQIEVLEKK